MIKIKLYELDKHRNETTFRPYLMAQNVLRDIGIEFTQGDSYDYAWVGQASFMNKKVSIEQSVNDGLEFLSKISGDYMLLDGQDATTLIGSYDLFKESNAMLLLKNTMLKDRSLYKQGWNLGRLYWGKGDYKCNDFDTYSDKIKLSGTNWLSTIPKPKWYDNIHKTYDVSALFSYPHPPGNIEFDIENNIPYDKHRKPCVDVINKLTCNVAKLVDGVKLPPREYYNRMASSKIVLAPLGYGEMAPRDIEAIQFGSILIKPDMSYIDSNPMWYEDGKTYIACKHDYSDLEEKINYVLDNFVELQQTMIPYARIRFDELYTLENTAINTYNIFSNLKNIST